MSYGIYGFSSFRLSPVSGCTAIDLNIDFKDINTVILQTDNTDALSDVFITADFYSKNNGKLCSAAGGPSRTIYDIKTQTFSTTPILENKVQDIQLVANKPTTI